VNTVASAQSDALELAIDKAGFRGGIPRIAPTTLGHIVGITPKTGRPEAQRTDEAAQHRSSTTTRKDSRERSGKIHLGSDGLSLPLGIARGYC